jgi:TolA-binding protein
MYALWGFIMSSEMSEVNERLARVEAVTETISENMNRLILATEKIADVRTEMAVMQKHQENSDKMVQEYQETNKRRFDKLEREVSQNKTQIAKWGSATIVVMTILYMLFPDIRGLLPF